MYNNREVNNNDQIDVMLHELMDDVIEVDVRNVGCNDSNQAVVPTDCHKNCSKTKMV